MSDIITIETTESSKIQTEHTKPKVGEWYWVKDEKKRWFGCVTHIGTNYVMIEAPNGGECRVHAKDFRAECTLEGNADKYINQKIDHQKRELARLADEIRELTADLGLSTVALPGGDTQALAVRSGDAVGQYKAALVKAKDKTLPDLFSEVRQTSESLKMWLGATTIPLKAQMADFKELIESINTRIFSVELCAGLVEEIKLVKDGKDASIGEKVHLMQRRAYMDEECLAQYETGGMDFKSIDDFDDWLARPDNLSRLLPFQRCVVAFRVRRHDKYREGFTLSDFIRIQSQKEQDKATFLYLRNGEKLFRLQTAIDFGPQLFPDMDAPPTHSQVMYANVSCGCVRDVINEHQYADLVKQEKAKEYTWPRSSDFQLFSPDNVMYDDIEAFLKKKIDEHNRLVVVLQGLMDRSPVFHPHPKFSLWKQEDFSSAFELVYDDSRALSSGDRPDFEAFRAELNASLAEGCSTIGQDEVWQIREAVKECNRMDSDWRTKRDARRPEKFRPYGDPGPGLIAIVQKCTRTKKCNYTWRRERRTYSRWEKSAIECNLVVEGKDLFNINAYVPGSYKRFFDDPRTRADYLKWAPVMLAAEEWHAGNKAGKARK